LASSADDPIELLPGHRIRFRDRNVAIDLRGIAKGFAVDRALYALREHGLPQAMVNAGGDLAVFGAEPESVVIRHPLEPDQLVCQVQLANERWRRAEVASICSSRRASRARRSSIRALRSHLALSQV